MPLEQVTTRVIEQWIASFSGSARTRNKVLIQLHGILGHAKRVYGLRENAAADVEKFQQRPSGDIQVFEPAEVRSLVASAATSATTTSPIPPTR